MIALVRNWLSNLLVSLCIYVILTLMYMFYHSYRTVFIYQYSRLYIYIYIYIYGNYFVLMDDNHLNVHHHPHNSCWVNRQWRLYHVRGPQVFGKWLDKNDPEPLRYLYFDGFKWHKLVKHQYHSLTPPNIIQWQAKARWLVNAVPSPRWMSHQ